MDASVVLNESSVRRKEPENEDPYELFQKTK